MHSVNSHKDVAAKLIAEAVRKDIEDTTQSHNFCHVPIIGLSENEIVSLRLYFEDMGYLTHIIQKINTTAFKIKRILYISWL